MKRRASAESGFSLIEMMVSVVVFMVLAGAAFGLLIAAQQRQGTESELLDSFQAARLSLDDIVRDVGNAGYPPSSFFSYTPPAVPPANLYAAAPFAWSPNYPNAPCAINATCTSPGSFDLIVETDLNPQDVNRTVSWIRYQLLGTTLYRSVVPKALTPDPAAYIAANSQLVPYVENVVNNPPPGQLARLQALYPGMFANGPVPVFSYFDSKSNVVTDPTGIVDVNVTLVVMAKDADPRTGVLRVAELNGRARRLNPGP